MLIAMTKVVLKVMPMLSEDVIVFILHLPARPSRLNDLFNILHCQFQIANKGIFYSKAFVSSRLTSI